MVCRLLHRFRGCSSTPMRKRATRVQVTTSTRPRWAAIGAAVAVSLGAGGTLFVQAASAPSSFVSIDPVRVLDTRTDVGLAGPFVSGASRDLTVVGSIPTATGPATVVPVGATGLAVNVTAVLPTAAGFISVRPADASGAITTSNLNFEAGDIVPNAVTVVLPTTGSDAGKVEITFDAFGAIGPTTDVLVDVVGYYVAGGAGVPGPAGPPGTPGAPGPGVSSPLRIGQFDMNPSVPNQPFVQEQQGLISNGGDPFAAPISLPDGATVTALRAVAGDNNGGADLTVGLYRREIGVFAAVFTPMANVATSGALGDYQLLETNVVADGVIDNESYQYVLLVGEIGTWIDLVFQRAEIEFTLP